MWNLLFNYYFSVKRDIPSGGRRSLLWYVILLAQNNYQPSNEVLLRAHLFSLNKQILSNHQLGAQNIPFVHKDQHRRQLCAQNSLFVHKVQRLNYSEIRSAETMPNAFISSSGLSLSWSPLWPALMYMNGKFVAVWCIQVG